MTCGASGGCAYEGALGMGVGSVCQCGLTAEQLRSGSGLGFTSARSGRGGRSMESARTRDTRGRRRYLLLLQLLVLKAAADCPRPEGRDHLVLTTEALLMNHFPDGIDVTLECGNGYVEESGSRIIHCSAGQWTEPDLKCKKKDCGPIPHQPNMSFDVSGGTLFGAVVQVHCDPGYQLSGTGYKQCYSSGWMGKAKCKIVTCEKPAAVANGRILWDSQDDPRYGETIHFVCDEGYSLTGPDSIMCSDTGEYDPQPPQCTGVTTQDRDTTKIVASSPAPLAQDPSAKLTTHRGGAIATSARVPLSTQGGRSVSTPGVRATSNEVAATTSSSFGDQHNETMDTDPGYVPVLISVLCILLVVIIVAVLLHRFLLRRKGSGIGTAPIS